MVMKAMFSSPSVAAWIHSIKKTNQQSHKIQESEHKKQEKKKQKLVVGNIMITIYKKRSSISS